MSLRVENGLRALTEKEKQTLRLIVRGHDAKSTARSLGLSVHTINERLRDARRKMAVSSSREAARLLLEAEDTARSPLPEKSVDDDIGDATSAVGAEKGAVPVGGARRMDRRPWMIGGLLMTIVLGLLVLAALPQAASAPLVAAPSSGQVSDSSAVDVAQQWPLLVDQGRWEDSYRATAAAFRNLNTVQTWAAASQKARVPLGVVVSRTFASQEGSPTPPYGYELVKFRTIFANKADAVEMVALDREDGRWRVVGVTIV